MGSDELVVETLKDYRRAALIYASVEVHSDYPFTYGFGPLTTKLPLGVRRRLGRVIGWHLMITAVR